MEFFDYENLANNYKPSLIKILLIGEAPPPSGKKYFYKVPENYFPSKSIENDTSLPGTIFNHYFGKRPNNSLEYENFLEQLKENGIFLIDMINEPLKIRDRKLDNGINMTNLEKLFSDHNLRNLKNKVNKLKNEETISIFLFARNYKKIYKDILKDNFPDSEFIRWIDFRLNITEEIINI